MKHYETANEVARMFLMYIPGLVMSSHRRISKDINVVQLLFT